MASFLNAYTCTSPRAGSAGRSPAPRLQVHRHVQLAAFVTLFTIAILEPQTHRVKSASCFITVQAWRAERCPHTPAGARLRGHDDERRSRMTSACAHPGVNRHPREAGIRPTRPLLYFGDGFGHQGSVTLRTAHLLRPSRAPGAGAHRSRGSASWLTDDKELSVDSRRSHPYPHASRRCSRRSRGGRYDDTARQASHAERRFR